MYEHNNIHMTTDKTVVLLLTVPFAVTKLKYFSISNFILFHYKNVFHQKIRQPD